MAGEKFKVEEVFEANEEALGSLHKDSRWDQQLKDFRDSNMVLDRLFEMKMKRAKSNNALGWVSHSADSQGQGLADSQGHSKMMDAEACANHHLPGPVGDGDQEPQRRGSSSAALCLTMMVKLTLLRLSLGRLPIGWELVIPEEIHGALGLGIDLP
ncbi:hypothetical protein R6Z07M_008828 [Ovis aries]